MSKMVRVTDDVYDKINRMKPSGMSVSSFIDERLDQGTPAVEGSQDSMKIDYLIDKVDELSERLQDAPQKKENPDPQKSRGLTPIRSRGLVQSELWAAEKRLKNIVSEVHRKAAEETWTDEEAGSYAYHLEEELREEINKLQDELNRMEG